MSLKPTLSHLLGISLVALAAGLALLFYIVFESSKAGLLASAEALRAAASREVTFKVDAFLRKAPLAITQVQQTLELGLVDRSRSESLEATLFSPLVANPDFTEVTLTYGQQLGFTPDGQIDLAPDSRGQWSVIRVLRPGGAESFASRHVHAEGSRFVSDLREFVALQAPSAWQREPGERTDPTLHPTFRTPASQEHFGHLLPSDLHWSELDSSLPAEQRRVEVSVQKAITDADGRFIGVLRIGILTRQLDAAVSSIHLTPDSQPDPHHVFICDQEGRLITRFASTDPLREYDDAFRIAPTRLPPGVATSLGSPMLAGLDSASATPISGTFIEQGIDYLATFTALPSTQDWVVGIVVPQEHYLRALIAGRDRLLLVSLTVMAGLILAGSVVIRAVRGGQKRIIAETSKMNRFDFSPGPTTALFRDVSEVLDSLEQAKTAMRAMGRYVPLDLVRRLYCSRVEPSLGGEDRELSVMFTDIQNFTTYSEQLPPNLLASALGRYLDVMSRIIQQESRGTIDKYIGDAIMSLWNAPETVPDHELLACRAALRCRDAARQLADSAEWRDLPPFETRVGLHRGEALVGHFGAHDRMNYTALGDTINLASRLEGLNKEYGTSIIASEAIVERARGHFVFRLLDRVIVKGKQHSVRIYELLDTIDHIESYRTRVDTYERAFGLYTVRDFSGALAVLAQLPDDPPAALLAERCRGYLLTPPPADWNGIYLASRK